MPTSRNTWRGKAFLLRVDQKRIGVSLNRRVKIGLAKTVYIPFDRHGLYPAFEKAGISPDFVLKMGRSGYSRKVWLDDLLARELNYTDCLIEIQRSYAGMDPAFNGIYIRTSSVTALMYFPGPKSSRVVLP
jgi:hypothetical protein